MEEIKTKKYIQKKHHVQMSMFLLPITKNYNQVSSIIQKDFDILLYEFDINIEELQDIERVKSYDGCIISLEKLQDLEREYVVEFCVNNGSSGHRIGKNYYTLHLVNGIDVDVYV